MIIGINGYSGSGKDLTGQIIQKLTAKENYGYLENTWEIKKWAGKLKTIASILTGIPVDKFEDEKFKKTKLPRCWDIEDSYGVGATYGNDFDHDDIDIPYERRMSVREFLQRLGTEAMRETLHEDTWVNALMADYNKKCNWVITDTRFHNEAYAIKKKGGIIIRIDRPGVRPTNDHVSETSLDNWNFDYKILNASDIVSLTATVSNILKKEKLL